MGIWYRTGTVSVTNGSAVVTGSVTTWLSTVKAGDAFRGPDGVDYEVLTVDSNTQVTLATNYGGSTVSGSSNYSIKPFSPNWSDTGALTLRIINFLQTIVGVYGGASAPSDGDGAADGSYYFRIDAPNSIASLYKKASGTWSVAISLMGLTGPVGPGFSTTSTTSIAIGTGSKVFTIPGSSGTSYLGARMRAARTSAPTTYLEGIVTAATSNTVTINADATSGSGTFTDWSIVVTGNVGAQGPVAPGNTGTSASSNSIGTGTKTFAVATGLNLAPGQRVRFSDAANPATNFVEGPITVYASGSMSIASDVTGGSGTITSWTFGIVGTRGPAGATGADSTVPGPVGPGYAATSTSSVAIGTGSKALTIGTGYAYQIGTRVRASDSSDPTNKWMEGECTAYASGVLTFSVDKTKGSGTIASWTVSVAGAPGTDGTNGTSPSTVGDYNGATTYSIGQIVRNGGASWFYINGTAGSGNAPPALPTTSNSYWMLVAQDGTNGTGTINSVNGDTGPDVTLTADEITVTGLTAAPGGTSILNHLSALYAASSINPNLLINGDGFINQRGATTAANDAYHVDRWYALTQTAACGISQLSNVADGIPSMIRMTQSNATAQRIGSAQIVEGIVSRELRSSDACFSGKVRMSAAATVAYAILAWTSTEDTVTSDVVATWTNATLTAGNFFLASNVSVVATGTLALSANTVTDFSVTGTVPSTCNNLIVMIWSSATMAQTATLDFRAKLEKGNVATAFVTPKPSVELDACYRYYQAIVPGSSGATLAYRLSTAYCIASGFPLKMKMRASPSISNSSPTWATAAPGTNNQVTFRTSGGSYATASGAITVLLSAGLNDLDRSITVQAATSISGTAGDIGSVQFGSGVTFYCDAEL